MGIRVLKGAELLDHTAALHSAYIDAFCAPPWNEDAGRAVEFVGRLPADARRPGFTAALAFAGGSVTGFATSWTTPSPFPTDRCHPQAAAGLGPERTVD